MKRWIGAVLAVILVACDTVEYEDVVDEVETRQPRGIAVRADDLAKIGVDEGYPLNGDYYLAEDVDLSTHSPWVPIGTAAAPFSGVFDGNGKTLRGLVISGGTAAHTGLFGYLLAARLFDLTIEIEDTVAVMTSAAAQYAGGAAGYIKASYIDGITIRGSGALYVVKTGAGGFWSGGLAGKLEESTVTNITVNLNLQATGDTLYAGLVAGESTGGTLASCFVEGTVDASATLTGVYAGGITGRHAGLMENCTSAVTRVSAESASIINIYAGGLAGYGGGSIRSCSVKADYPVLIQGALTTTATVAAITTAVYAGGISGYCGTSASAIDRCVVDAPIRIVAESESATQNVYAGGLTGQSANITNSSIRRGEVLVKATSTATTTGSTLAAGGIAGIANNNNSPKIVNCFSAANVTVDSALKAVLAAFPIEATTAAGGVVGVLGTTNGIEYSGASGAVRVISSSSEVVGVSAFAGGIVGYGRYVQGISIKQSAALNESVTVESGAAAPYAYRILGGAPTAGNGTTVIAPDAVSDNTYLDLYSNYALPDMTVQTKLRTGALTDVPQEPNNAANLTGDGNMERTAEFLESQLGWNFSADWEWDDEADLPFPRIN